jgi:hypothetical protein
MIARELKQGLPHDGARHPVDRRNLLLGELGAGRQTVFDDGCGDGRDDGLRRVGQRASAAATALTIVPEGVCWALEVFLRLAVMVSLLAMFSGTVFAISRACSLAAFALL